MNTALATYFAELMPAAPVECVACGNEVAISKAVVRDDKFFCCADHAERHLAPKYLARPTGTVIDGFDI